MPVLGLNHINLSGSRDLLNALKDFYCDVIGLEVGARPNFERFGYWLYAGGQPVVHLYQSAPGEARRADVLTTFDHLAFTCADSTEFEAVLRRRGVEYSKAVVPGTDQVQLFLKDPAGIKVELNFPASAS
jgi:catechol 2,3-dioxygenase-like lactoylglutathione lyase family enzyme